jgi:hypothetical protein
VEYGSDYELIRNDGQGPIAVSNDKHSLITLRDHIESITPSIVSQLQNLANERQAVVRHFENFNRAIYLIRLGVKWNKPFKGRCGWEKNFKNISS